MKKLLILSAVLALSACACWNSDEPAEETVVYQNVQARPQNCDYYDGTTCYRYVRRVHQAPVIRYREPRPAPAPVVVPAVSCPCQTASCGCQAVQPACSGCAPQVRETREPVEVVYKKTTYTTTYQPNTTAAVSYERAPYAQARVSETSAPAQTVSAPIEIVTAAPASVEVVTPADRNEEILLNVK